MSRRVSCRFYTNVRRWSVSPAGHQESPFPGPERSNEGSACCASSRISSISSVAAANWRLDLLGPRHVWGRARVLPRVCQTLPAPISRHRVCLDKCMTRAQPSEPPWATSPRRPAPDIAPRRFRPSCCAFQLSALGLPSCVQAALPFAGGRLQRMLAAPPAPQRTAFRSVTGWQACRGRTRSSSSSSSTP